MQVSTLCANSFYSIDISGQKSNNESGAPTYNSSSNFMLMKKYDSQALTDKISEWKFFCEEQIMANNMDYIA